MRSAESYFDSFILPDNRSGSAQLWEKLLRQSQPGHNLRVNFSGFGIHHAHCGGICVLFGFHSAELIQQVFRHHQKIRDALEPPGELVRIKLVYTVEGLKLDSRASVQLRERNNSVYLGNGSFCATVPVSVNRKDLFVALHQHIVYTPSVNGHTLDRISHLCLQNALFYMADKAFSVPDEVPVLICNGVGKAINLFCSDFAVFHPADNMPSGGCADVNGKYVFHNHHRYY